MTTPSPQQIELLHHTLGLSQHCSEPFRNHYVAGPGHYAQAALLELVRMGLMERARAQVFRVTDAGKTLAMRKRWEQMAFSESHFGNWFLCSPSAPEMECQYSGRPLVPLYRMYRVEAGRSWIRDIEGTWCRTKKGAKASYYKAALKEHQRRQRELKKLEEAA